ncbi:MAG: threonine synthase, partial [Proteobacteria bacterium]|nr:threonine synthase [Pseudomonadota bacterium]
MKIENFPEDIQPYLIPDPVSDGGGRLIYRCLECGQEYGIEKLLYTCPECGQVLLIYDANFDRLK